jgi:hypothetical protein
MYAFVKLQVLPFPPLDFLEIPNSASFQHVVWGKIAAQRLLSTKAGGKRASPNTTGVGRNHNVSQEKHEP